MNNLTFGNDRVQYYETVASGSGAGDGFDGTDAVQTHMTNSRLTDPEILEWRLPVLLESFAVREGSGGAGRWHGGGGVERRIRFLEPVTVALLSGHRRVPPTGRRAGSRGRSGSSTSSGREAASTGWRGATPPNWRPVTCWWSGRRAAAGTGPRGRDRGRVGPPGSRGAAVRHRSHKRRFDRCRCEDLICSS
ncbi:hypothetical protein SMICM17S_08701 [Streptomyces microflavus]